MGKSKLHSKSIFIFGILSVFFSWLYAIPGLVFGLMARSLAKKLNDKKGLNFGPDSEKKIKTAQTGKVLANFGLIISGFFLLLLIIKEIFSFLIN
jgi:hypothetical protein